MEKKAILVVYNIIGSYLNNVTPEQDKRLSELFIRFKRAINGADEIMVRSTIYSFIEKSMSILGCSEIEIKMRLMDVSSIIMKEF